MDESTADLLFKISTAKTGPFRTLIEAIKEILTDVNLEIDPTGIKIRSMDSTHMILVSMFLQASKFEQYMCSQKFVLGVTMPQFYRLIKTMGTSDNIVLFQRKGDTSKLCVDIFNDEKTVKTHYSLNLHDFDIHPIPIPKVVFPCVLTMPSTNFQKIIRDMNVLGEEVEIQSSDTELVFRCKGEYAEQETIFTFGTNGVAQTHEGASEIVQGVFNIENLNLFTKCTSLCSDIKLHMRNDYPIIVEYDVAGLGEIKLALAPIPPSVPKVDE